MTKLSFEKIKPCLSGFLGAIIFTVVYLAFQSSPELVSVNVNRLVQDHIKERAHSTLSEQELQIDSQRFMARLEQTMNSLAKEEYLYIVVSDAIVSGPKDYTEIVRRRMEYAP